MTPDDIGMNWVDAVGKIMSEIVVEKIREVPARGGKGSVTVILRMPEVTITDA